MLTSMSHEEILPVDKKILSILKELIFLQGDSIADIFNIIGHAEIIFTYS